MLKAYKYRIYPTSEQRLYLAKTFGCTRFVYNQMLADRIKSYEENKDLYGGLVDMWEWAQTLKMRERFKWPEYEINKGLYSYWK